MGNPVGNVDPNGRSTDPSPSAISLPPGFIQHLIGNPPPLPGYQQLQQYQSAAQEQLKVINALQWSMGLFPPGSPEWNSLNSELTQAQNDYNAIQAEESNALMQPLPPIQPSNGGGGNGDVCLWPNFVAGGIDLGADTTLAITQRIADEALLGYAADALAFALLP